MRVLRQHVMVGARSKATRGAQLVTVSLWCQEANIARSVLQLGILVLRHLSYGRTARSLPKLCGCRFPIEGVVARAVLFQVIESRDRLLDARPVAGRHPPHHEITPIEMLEPF